MKGILAKPIPPNVVISYSKNPVVSGAILFGSMVAGIAGARATGRWFDRVAPKISSKISISMAHMDAALHPDEEDEDDE